MVIYSHADSNVPAFFSFFQENVVVMMVILLILSMNTSVSGVIGVVTKGESALCDTRTHN